MKSTPTLLFLGFIAVSLSSGLAPQAGAQAMELATPYVSQVPDGNWVAPWNEACEEASITMISGFYRQVKTISKEEGKRSMQTLIDWENKTLKHNEDATADEIVQMVHFLNTFDISIKRSPSIEDIKRELDAQQPVIALVDMYKFYAEAPRPNNYHVFVIIGYDDSAKQFIVNDPGREAQRYSYERVMQALHDYNHTSKLANGEATVLFTSAKLTALQQAFLNFWAFLRKVFA